jgi:hypothetical protein
MTSDQFWRIVITSAFMACVPVVKSLIRRIGERGAKRRS